MLRALRPTDPASTAPEDVFLPRYARLYDRALRLTRNREQAEDLVQDIFVQFVLGPTAPTEIRNLDAYLFTMLQHMHASQVRRAVRARQVSLDLVDHDSAELALKGTDAAGRLAACEALKMVCDHACSRRLSSKTGSVLLLRYFHGYYVREIARILGCPPGAVDGLLYLARREARAHLENPYSPRERWVPPVTPPACGGEPSALPSGHPTRHRCLARSDLSPSRHLDELCRRIFARAHARCFPTEWFERLLGARREALSCQELADLVTCPRCLDRVSRVLGLPTPDGRHPTDSLDADRRSGPGTGAASGGGEPPKVERLRRLVDDVREHRPQALQVSVNGFVVASQRVEGGRSDLAVSVSIGEPIGFVEVFSEQGVRLLFQPIQPVPAGPVEHHAHVALADGRSLNVALDCAESWPLLRIQYLDPAPRTHASTASEPQPAHVESPPVPGGDAPTSLDGPPAWLAWLRWCLRPPMLPATLAVVALVLWTAYSSWKAPGRPAQDLLDRAARVEEADARVPQRVGHRVVSYEQRRPEDGSLIRASRVEVWRDADTSATARRVFEAGTDRLIALELVRPGEEAVIYRPQVPPERPGGDAASLPKVDPDSMWRVEPSVRRFQQVLATLGPPVVDRTPAAYVVSAERRSGDAVGRIVRAVLSLARGSLRPLSLVLVVHHDTGVREHRYGVSRDDHVPTTQDTLRVFTPDPGLQLTDTGAVPGDQRARSAPVVNLSPGEVAALQLDILHLLDRAGATLGEQVVVRGGPSGVRVEAVVETAGRKREILAALDPVRRHPAVTLDVLTIGERVARAGPLRGPTAMAGIEPQQDRPAAHDLVRGFLLRHPDPSWPDEGPDRDRRVEAEVLRIGAQAIDRARAAAQRAWALEHLVELLPPAVVASLTPARQETWRAMVHEHATNVGRHTAALRGLLAPVFETVAAGAAPRARAASDDDLLRAARELREMAVRQDEAVRAAFTLQSRPATTLLSPNESRFWEDARRVESMAAAIVLRW